MEGDAFLSSNIWYLCQVPSVSAQGTASPTSSPTCSPNKEKANLHPYPAKLSWILSKLFDSRINAIEVIDNDVFVGFENLNELLPIGITGDGLRRYLNIVAGTANPMNNIILIDEIDNGLHYTAYRKLWESIFMLAVRTNKQVFVTTHSKETLSQLQSMLQEHNEYQSRFRMYTIEKTLCKGHKAYKCGYEGLESACMNDVELRSIAL